MLSLLRQLVAIPSVSGHERPVVEHLSEFAQAHGLACDLWSSSESELEHLYGPLPPHFPLAGRPTLVATLPGAGTGPSLIFNAHSDVVAVPDPAAWSVDPWAGEVRDGVVFGRGACDTKGPLVAALWAMLMLKQSGFQPGGDLRLEVVPGEEDCVGLGTLGSIARGYRADAAIVLEPTRNLPRCASRAGCRFVITTSGRAVHGTVKWLGLDAIGLMRTVQDALPEIERAWNDRAADPLFAEHPIARPITVDSIRGGDWQGMVCDRCTLAGYLELLPLDDPGMMMSRFRDEVLRRVAGAGGDPARIRVEFTERYAGHRTSPESQFCSAASVVAGARGSSIAALPAWSGWSAFNSGCEAGVRAKHHGTPTLVWGPGDLAHAHAADERVVFDDVQLAAQDFAAIARRWCGGMEDT